MTLRRLLPLIVALAVGITAWAGTFADETLHYKVMYKWGLIQKTAGYATISLHSHGNQYQASLTAYSAPWADRLFRVRDTLTTVMDRATLRPSRYQKIAHEGGDDKLDIVLFDHRSDGTVLGHCSRRKVNDGRVREDNQFEVEATGMTVDMLSSFYFMRQLPFDRWSPGESTTINIFSGKRKELLTLRLRGIETVKIDDRSYECYHVTFIFTSDGGKKTSDDMDAWITTDAARTAVKLQGNLPVGKVRCLLIPELPQR